MQRENQKIFYLEEVNKLKKFILSISKAMPQQIPIIPMVIIN